MGGIVNDPLELLIKKYGFNPADIREIIVGSKYCAVVLQDSSLGVCATLGNLVETEPQSLRNPDLGKNSHRIVVNAYFNARLNPKADCLHNKDILEVADFRTYQSPVMIGLFKPVVKKLKEIGVRLAIFDPRHDPEENEGLLPDQLQGEYLQRADAVILSATTIFNQSFSQVIAKIKNSCDVFILGPSTPLATELFQHQNVCALFGTVFKPDDQRVLEVIKAGKGTRSFIKFASKAVLEK